MRTDRTLKFLLVVIAIGVWSLTMTQVGTPVAGAAESPRPFSDEPRVGVPQGSTAQGAKQATAATGVTRAPTSPLPLRWRVSWATLETDNYDTFCGTAVIVTNTTNASVDVDVEMMRANGTSAGRATETLVAYGSHTAITLGSTNSINVGPYWYDDGIASQDFSGYALVGGDDPRIMVSAYQFCRSGLGYSGAIVRSHTNIPTFPVGATADFFQAGLPAAWTPPVAIAEEPE